MTMNDLFPTPSHLPKRRWEPVAYDKSIRAKGRMFEATIRFDDEEHTFERHSLEEAQKLLDCFPDDVYEGPWAAPASYSQERQCETLVM